MISGPDGKCKCPVEAGFGGNLRTGKVRILNDVENPGRRGTSPNTAGQADTGGECAPQAVCCERGGFHVRGVPEINCAQQHLLLVHVPEDTDFPVQALADGLEDARCGVMQGRGFSQRSCDLILRRQAPCRPLGLCKRLSKIRDHDRVPAAHIAQHEEVCDDAKDVPIPPAAVPRGGAQKHDLRHAKQQTQAGKEVG